MAVAGWYPDPADPNVIRFWDGAQWTPATQVRHSQMAVPGNVTPPLTAVVKKKPNRTLQVLAGVFLAVFVGGVAVSALIDNTTPRIATAERTSLAPSAPPAAPESVAPAGEGSSSDVFGPLDRIQYEDGLTAAITAVSGGPSSSRLDDSGPYTVISYQLGSTGSDTLDAADWRVPYVNYGSTGVVADNEYLLGTIDGIEPELLKGSGLILPGGIGVSPVNGATLF